MLLFYKKLQKFRLFSNKSSLNRRLLFVSLLFVGLFMFNGNVYASTITMPSTLATDTSSYVLLSSSGTTPSVSGFSTDLVITLLVANGNIKITTTTGLTVPTGYAAGDWTGNSTIAFEGSQTNVNNALATLSYQGTGSASTTLEASATPTGASYNSDNGHYYEYVDPGDGSRLTWTQARDASEAKTFNGLTGYLVTITSLTESNFVATKVPAAIASWAGASDVTTEDDWRWVTGPEGQANSGTGTPFWSGKASGSGGVAVDGAFTNWNTTEPNSNVEDYLERQSTGEWNDVPNDGWSPPGTLKPYVVEYGGLDGETATVEGSTNISITNTQDSPPVVISSTPADSSTGAVISTNIVLTFSEAIRNTDNSEITDSNVDALITIKEDDNSGSSIDFDATINAGKTVITINPTSDFSSEQVVYVAIGATVEDSAGNAMSATSITFDVADIVAPIISEVTVVTTPTNDTTPNYTFTSDEVGTISYGGSCSSLTTSASVGSNTVTLVALSDGIYSNCTVTVTDASTNASDIITITSFTIETVAPTATLSPLDNATDVAINSNLTITLNEAVDAESGNITIYKTSDDSTIETIDVTDTDIVTGSGGIEISINPTSNFDYETEYYVQIDTTAFDDLAGNSFAGINDAVTWRFLTVNLLRRSVVTDGEKNVSQQVPVESTSEDEGSSKTNEEGTETTISEQNGEDSNHPVLTILVKTANNKTVYQVNPDGTRSFFPDEKHFFSYYSDYSEVQEITAENLASKPLSKPITYKEGSLIKLTTSPKVYYVSKDATLRWIVNEQVFNSLGFSFTIVNDLDDSLFPLYQIGENLSI